MYLVEPNWLDWHEEEVAIPGLPVGLEGFRICHLSDLHVGGGASVPFLEHVVQGCNRMQPDLIVLTGDLINRKEGEVAACGAVLAKLRSPCGVFAILGGHDYRQPPDLLVETLRRVGVRVLHNEGIAIGPEGSKIWLAGLDDNSGYGRPDLNAAMGSAPTGAPVVLLMHSPDSIMEVAARGIPLALAGHTHGGQVCLPFIGAILTMSRFRRRFVSGRHRVDKTILYVSRGVGSHHHIRLLARPEIIQFTLVPE